MTAEELELQTYEEMMDDDSDEEMYQESLES